MGGRYLFRKRWARMLMVVVDGIGRLLVPAWPEKKSIPPPRRILISNIAHFGDVVIALALVPVLKRVYPEAEIGFLAGSWSRKLLEVFPEIKWIHSFDHPLLNREAKIKMAALIQGGRSFHQATAEIRQVKYDVAIESYHFLQNSIPLLWWAGVPVRIGYTCGGFGTFLTHPHMWHYQSKSILEYHFELLRDLGIEGPPPVCLPWPKRRNVSAAEALVPEKPYIILHPGGGAEFKAWPLSRWKDLARILASRGERIVLTGRGVAEQKTIEAIMAEVPNGLNLCDTLDWDSFLEVIRNARLLIGIDSLAGHLAAALDIRSIIIMTGINPAQFSPISDKNQIVSWPVPCSPCFLPKGCEGVECVQNVSLDSVLQAYEKAVNAGI